MGLVRTRRMKKLYKKANEERLAKLANFFSTVDKDFWVFSTEDSIEKRLPNLLVERNMMRR